MLTRCGIGKLILIDSWLKLILVAVVCGVIGFVISIVIMFNKTELKKSIKLIKNKIFAK